MKKLILLTVLLFGLITQKSSAQCTNPTNTYGGTYYLGFSSPGGPLPFATNGTPQMTLTTNGDLNINGAMTGGRSGYQINGRQMLYTGNDPTSVFVGGQIPVAGSYTLPYGNNTCIGNSTYASNIGAYSNTFAGAWAGSNIIDGHKNTYLGDSAGCSDQHGIFNTYIGYMCGALTTGLGSGPFPIQGSFNTMCGFECGYSNTTGTANNYYGKGAGYYQNGLENCMFGSHSGEGIPPVPATIYNVDSNAFFGNASGHGLYEGSGNVFVGAAAAYNSGSFFINNNVPSYKNVFLGGNVCPTNPGGDHNVVIGYAADAYTNTTLGSIHNSVAIGADALVQNDNQFILGNDAQFIGIGLSGLSQGPQANLEIATEYNTAAPLGPYPTTYGFLGVGNSGSSNPYNGTGFSGLKFYDLTSFSTPADQTYFSSEDPYPAGVLSVDGFGNVIYINSSGGFGKLFAS